MQVLNPFAYSDCFQFDPAVTNPVGKQFKAFIVNSLNFGSPRTLFITIKTIANQTKVLQVNCVRNTSDGRIILVEHAGNQIVEIVDSTTLSTPGTGQCKITLLN